MKDKKITDSNGVNKVSTDDLFHVVDSPSSSPSNKKITVNTYSKKSQHSLVFGIVRETVSTEWNNSQPILVLVK